MKFFLFLAIVLLGVWLWRSGRRVSDERAPPPPPPAPPGRPQEMIRCSLCGTHLPMSEAVTGRIGIYCSAEHRNTAEP